MLKEACAIYTNGNSAFVDVFKSMMPFGMSSHVVLTVDGTWRHLVVTSASPLRPLVCLDIWLWQWMWLIFKSMKTSGMSWLLVVTDTPSPPTVQSNTIYSIHFYAQFDKTSEIEEACYVMSKGWSWHRMSNCRSEWVMLPRPLDVHEEYNDLHNGRSLVTPAWLWLLEKQETLALLCSPISVIHDWEARLE